MRGKPPVVTSTLCINRIVLSINQRVLCIITTSKGYKFTSTCFTVDEYGALKAKIQMSAGYETHMGLKSMSAVCNVNEYGV